VHDIALVVDDPCHHHDLGSKCVAREEILSSFDVKLLILPPSSIKWSYSLVNSATQNVDLSPKFLNLTFRAQAGHNGSSLRLW